MNKKKTLLFAEPTEKYEGKRQFLHQIENTYIQKRSQQNGQLRFTLCIQKKKSFTPEP